MYVSKDGRDRTPIVPLQTGRQRTASTLMNVLEKKLVHPVTGSVCFPQNLANFHAGNAMRMVAWITRIAGYWPRPRS